MLGIFTTSNYFIDESVATGKGANATISYVHDFLENHGAGETNVHLHADNCGGQNKNNYVLWTGAGVSSMAYMRTYGILTLGSPKMIQGSGRSHQI